LILVVVLIASTSVSALYLARSNFTLRKDLKKDATASFLVSAFSKQPDVEHKIIWS